MKNEYCSGCRETSQIFCRKLYYVGEEVRWHKACICSECLKYIRDGISIWWKRNENDHLLPEINKLKNDIEKEKHKQWVRRERKDLGYDERDISELT